MSNRRFAALVAVAVAAVVALITSLVANAKPMGDPGTPRMPSFADPDEDCFRRPVLVPVKPKPRAVVSKPSTPGASAPASAASAPPKKRVKKRRLLVVPSVGWEEDCFDPIPPALTAVPVPPAVEPPPEMTEAPDEPPIALIPPVSDERPPETFEEGVAPVDGPPGIFLPPTYFGPRPGPVVPPRAVLVPVAPIPEPKTSALLALGIASIAFVVRTRRHA